MLTRDLPTDDELELLLGAIRDDLRGRAAPKQRFLADFRDFCDRAEYVIPHHKFTRYFGNGKGLNLRDKIYLYEFIIHIYTEDCRRRPDKLSKRHLSMINSWKVEYATAREDADPFDFIKKNTIEGIDRDLARSLSKKYLGYRLSSNRSYLIRFSLSVQFEMDSEISFVNKYDREGVRWTSRGGGLLHGQTLYLFGRARDESNADVDRGYRVLCLSRWRESNILQGVVISHDKIGPLAARFVAIPCDDHDFSVPPEYVKAIKSYENSTGRPWDPWRDAIDVDREYVSEIRGKFEEDQLSGQFLMAAYRQTNRAINFDNATNPEDVGLLHFINNITGTTLHGYLKPRLSEAGDAVSDLDQEFDGLVDQVVAELENTTAPPRDTMARIIRGGLKSLNG